jgi:hypothetical protein
MKVTIFPRKAWKLVLAVVLSILVQMAVVIVLSSVPFLRGYGWVIVPGTLVPVMYLMFFLVAQSFPDEPDDRREPR